MNILELPKDEVYTPGSLDKALSDYDRGFVRYVKMVTVPNKIVLKKCYNCFECKVGRGLTCPTCGAGHTKLDIVHRLVDNASLSMIICECGSILELCANDRGDPVLDENWQSVRPGDQYAICGVAIPECPPAKEDVI